ncbi:unnamed protein product [Soboliphyme baturini]|uniref:Polyglutamine tract-binding protein 1 n=1 Tax=Soboliphyme baturini TaxID=241478 RepID=A0A3P8ES63_9BILA|nr:unnamed protein product [Soboliphyme baturini]
MHSDFFEKLAKERGKSSKDRKKRNSDDESEASSEESEDERKRVRRRDAGRVKRDLDPMDPAAYSDVPRGRWSTGLDARGEAKTGVDSTVSGPLFQQRPYPAPGAILRQNTETHDKRKR